ncbi:alpha/beta-hydrolase [Aspergillus japonicus CBS 114.51]|uniref:Alpha/beta-hydrolase n=2 Tax=Aspergillus TaxID=5052 RepID=A0A2V5HPU3_ASPV1|nr:alpha/beta-hydrolase [Aspergillus japonicus CBS 114.51]PYI24124.1 alpha/beta-hydrolase [Aspergillus violaceofuscus CBS 115571]RAH85823.1 alpha/beta-hydrolase [Aspergillus japonicus CBS 114.51]
MKRTPLPTIIICHGSYHTPTPYTPFLNHLTSQGYEVHCPQRPTSDLTQLNVGNTSNPDFDRPPPPTGYPSDAADVAVIQTLLDRLILQENKQVLLVAHSSGGWVATQAATPKYQDHPQASPSTKASAGILGIFYYGAFLVPIGESVTSYFQPEDGSFVVPPFCKAHKHGPKGLLSTVDAATYMFGQLPREEGQKWAASLTAAPIMTGVLTNDAYAALPCGYLVLEEDRALAAAYQEGMVQALNARLRGEGRGEVVVYRARTDHSPHLSWIKGLVGVIGEFVGGLER